MRIEIGKGRFDHDIIGRRMLSVAEIIKHKIML